MMRRRPAHPHIFQGFSSVCAVPQTVPFHPTPHRTLFEWRRAAGKPSRPARPAALKLMGDLGMVMPSSLRLAYHQPPACSPTHHHHHHHSPSLRHHVSAWCCLLRPAVADHTIITITTMTIIDMQQYLHALSPTPPKLCSPHTNNDTRTTPEAGRRSHRPQTALNPTKNPRGTLSRKDLERSRLPCHHQSSLFLETFSPLYSTPLSAHVLGGTRRQYFSGDTQHALPFHTILPSPPNTRLVDGFLFWIRTHPPRATRRIIPEDQQKT
ncbi:uncharacterized protein K489DRAFT_37663 [Dissoconium aciculare CBS 342.82]|uniref:Uncharacterized protein n=1 Tax=Dissoconium aciculare CBS 342.82 TaxID=1314786 RepID=A0A6J3LXX9_9PEZI|nr:uncharacterized protein K489DRAFT_37663 [Dissoconium aciculare CBS 342.82]KAF1820615.1 hypothetical protein K489DRAFT_37663 [Dissoconium aciculare CBS 342.82]